MGAISCWTDKEKAAWFPPEKLSPSQWTERHRTLPASVAAEAGKLRLDRTPYIRGILDAAIEAGLEEIVILKCAQMGFSTALESWTGWCIDNEPGPILYVLPSEKAAKEVLDERLAPLIETTPCVRSHLSPNKNDFTLTAIKFDTCSIYMGWAGSADALSRRAIRYCFFDEVDKFPTNIGREADPISLGTERTSTFGYRRKVFIGSTPTTRQGTIWKAWELAGDKRYFYVPCPHCGEYQTLVFGQIKYPELNIIDRNAYADAIEQKSLAYYECVSCRKPIRESSKPKMLLQGVWLSEGQSIDKSGKIAGTKPKAKRVGFCLNGLYSPWRSFSAIAAEHRKSLSDPGRLQNFRNSWLAEPWEEVVRTANVEDLRKLTQGAPKANIIPAWAEFILATADVQKDRFYWLIRAWGADFKSQLISYGLALSFDELRKLCLETQFKFDDAHKRKGTTARPQMLLIDAGYRTDEVYQFAREDERIRPIKGDNGNQHQMVKYSSAGKDSGVPLWLLNTQLLKDRLSVFRNDGGRWLLNDAVSDEYLQHLASEHKTLVQGKEVWQRKSSGAANHYLDCEVYQFAAAEIARVDLIPTEDGEKEQPPQLKRLSDNRGAEEKSEIKFYEDQRKQTQSWIPKTKDWLRG